MMVKDFPSKPLIIGVDIRDLRIAKTGTKTYLEEICKAFKTLENDWLKFHFFDTFLPVYTGNNKLLKLAEHANYQFWKQIFLPVKAAFKKCDIIFCTDNVVPIIKLGYKTIPVFHDAFFFENPEHYGKIWLWLYLKTAIPAANSSPYIIVPTNYAKKQISFFTKNSGDKLIVVPEGPKTLASDINEINSIELLNAIVLRPREYILHVGSLFKRKNLPRLIEAFGKIKAAGYPELKLVLAGPIPANKAETDYQSIKEAIKKANLQQDVILTGYLSDTELNQLYKNALLYVFPSVNEGFGIPVLEAFRHNLPVLVADNTCLPEVGGEAVLTFDPFNVNAIFQAIKIVLDNPELRKEMIKKGQNRLKDFSWERTALEIVEVFKKAV